MKKEVKIAKGYREDAVFTVSLDGVKLSNKQIKNIDEDIKSVVMSHLADIDHQGDMVINRKLEYNPKFKDIIWDGRTLGIWIEDFERFRGRIQGF